MVSVGVKPTDEQIKIFHELKTDHKYRALSLKLNDTCDKLETDDVYPREATIKEISEKLPKNDCRFLVFDFEYETFENPPRATSKLLLLCWCPDSTHFKRRIPFAGTRGSVKAEFPGIMKDIQATDLGMLDYDELRKELCD